MPEYQDINSIQLPDIFGKKNVQQQTSVKSLSLDSVKLPDLFGKDVSDQVFKYTPELLKPLGVDETKADFFNRHDNEIVKGAKAKGGDPNVVKAIMFQETHLGENNTDSTAGARGLAQTYPAVVEGINNALGYKGADRYTMSQIHSDPKRAAEYIADYLNVMKKERGANSVNELIISYNARPEYLDKYRKALKNGEDALAVLPEETQKFIRDVKQTLGSSTVYDFPWSPDNYVMARPEAPKPFEKIPKENADEISKSKFGKLFTHEPESTKTYLDKNIVKFDDDFKAITGKSPKESGVSEEEAVRHTFKNVATAQIRSLANTLTGSVLSFFHFAGLSRMSGQNISFTNPKTGETFTGVEPDYKVNLSVAFEEWQKFRQHNQAWLDSYDMSAPEDVAAFVTGVFADLPIFGGFGKIGSATIKGGQTFTKELIKRGVSEEAANKFLASGLNRISSEIVRSGHTVGTTLGGYDAIMSITNQLASGKTIDEISYSEALKSGGKNYLLGTAVGPIGVGSRMLSKVVGDKILGPVVERSGLLDNGVSAASKVMPEKLAGSTAVTRWLADKGIMATGLAAETGLFLAADEQPNTFADFVKLYSEFLILKGPGGVKGFFGDPAKKVTSEFDIRRNLERSNITPEELRAAGAKDVADLSYKMTDKTYLDKIINDKNIPATLRTKIMASMHPEMQFNMPDLTKSTSEVKTPVQNKEGKWTVKTADESGNIIEVKDYETSKEADEIAKGANDKIKINTAFDAYKNGLPIDQQAKIDSKLQSLGYDAESPWEEFRNDPSLIKHPSQRIGEGEAKRIESAVDFILKTKTKYDADQARLREKIKKEAEKRKEEGIPKEPEPKVEVPKEYVPEKSPVKETVKDLPKNGEVPTEKQLYNLAEEKGLINDNNRERYQQRPGLLAEYFIDGVNSEFLKRTNLTDREKNELAFIARSFRDNTPLNIEGYESKKEQGQGRQVLTNPPEKAGEEISPAKTEASRLKEEAKAKFSSAFNDLANIVGTKKNLLPEERASAIEIIKKLADGISDYAKAEGILLKDAIKNLWKEYFPDKEIDESLIDEALGGTQNAKEDRSSIKESSQKEGVEGGGSEQVYLRDITSQVRLEAKEGKRITLSEEIRNSVTELAAKEKVDRFVKEREDKINKLVEADLKKVMKIVEEIDKEGQAVEFKQHVYIVKNIKADKNHPEGKVIVLDPWTRNRKGQPTVVGDVKLKKDILNAIDPERGKSVTEIIKKIYEGHNAYRDELISKAEKQAQEYADKYRSERGKKIPEPATKFSSAPPSGTTEFQKPGKKTREKLPSETGETVTMTERALKNLRLTAEQSAAYDAEKDVVKKYKILTDAILTNIKEAKDNKNITDGQYKSIIRRLGNAATERNREAAIAYVDKVLEGSEYKGQLDKAKKIAENVISNKSKIGQYNQWIIDHFKKFDLSKLTIDELYQFNSRAERILKSKDVPNLKAAEDVIIQFFDKVKEEERAEKVVSAATLDKYVEEIHESLVEKIESADDYKSIQRKITTARKLIDKLIDKVDENGDPVLTEENVDRLTELFGDIHDKLKAPSGEINRELEKLVDGYINEIVDMKKTFNSEINDAIAKVDKEVVDVIQEILSANKEDLKDLGIGDIEAYDEFILNLKDGYITPYLGELKKQIIENRRAKAYTTGAAYNIGSSKRFGQLEKQNWVNKKLSFWQKAKSTNVFDAIFKPSFAKLSEKERKLRIETYNLQRTVMSTKYHRLDLYFGNPSRKETIGIIATLVDRKINQAHIKEEEYNVVLDKMYKAVDKKYKNAFERKKFLRNMAIFLVERSWQSSPEFRDGKVSEANKSINGYNFDINPGDAIKKAMGDAQFRDQQESWTEFNKMVKDNNLTKIMKDKEGNDVEVIDTEKLENYLRKDKTASDFIDSIDKWYGELSGMNTAASFENGIGAGQLKNYFPFFTAQVGKGRNPAEITLDRFQNYHAAMKANSTFERGRKLQLVNLDIRDVSQKYVRAVTRNYYVLPELHAAVGALNKGFKKAGEKLLAEDPNNKQKVESLNRLNQVLVKDLQERIDRYYKAGRYAESKDLTRVDKVITASKKSVLALTVRILPEFASNTLRATLSLGNIPLDQLAKFGKYDKLYKAKIDEVVGSKYISRYGGDIDIKSSKGTWFGERGANWIITFSDTQVGRRLFAVEFEKAFKQISGKEFDIEKDANDPQYRIDNRIYNEQASHAALRKVEELFNDKSPLTTPTLTTFLGGMYRADSRNIWTKLFDYLQSYNRNESEQIIDSVRRMSYSKRYGQEWWQGIRDINAIIWSNATYNVLRQSLMIAAQYAITGFKEEKITPYQQKMLQEMKDGKFFVDKFTTSTIGLAFGGSSNVYKTVIAPALFVIDQSDLLTKEQKDKMFQAIERDYYVKRMPDYGTPESVFEAIPVIPSNVTKDFATGVEDLVSIFDAAIKFSPDRKTAVELISVINTGLLYFAPNMISPALHKQIKGVKYNMEQRIKAIKQGDTPRNPWEYDLRDKFENPPEK